ncbi:MAG TPA: LytTR family DNA-binding domain-containing protein [Chitinophagaceae bacterium]|nr:LytTR family DNA-binding domain-containing protein [Chitinophagaceae bacterium]
MLGTIKKQKDLQALTFLVSFVAVLVVVILLQDYLRSILKSYSFYLSESVMFSSFWWLFAPLMYAQYIAISRKLTHIWSLQVLLIIMPIVFHLLAFPLLVWAMSGLFYYHTYAFQQVFSYAISEHLYQLALLYSIPFLLYQLWERKWNSVTYKLKEENKQVESFIDSISISDGSRKLRLPVSEVMCFTASAPYLCIHCSNKKYLWNGTLKSIYPTLDPTMFVRVHKSTIVNIHAVAFYTSRHNGDYDLTLTNGTVIRLSRNFAVDFKKLFNDSHPVAPE